MSARPRDPSRRIQFDGAELRLLRAFDLKIPFQRIRNAGFE
jgi:hypothetical protein